MKREIVLKHQFVEYIPDELSEGVVYISVTFATASHKCCCGCGKEVVTPFSPTDWKLIFDGVSISLDPSIGNWSFDCQSHYWIRHNRVHWAGQWSREEIDLGRKHDAKAKQSNTKTEILAKQAEGAKCREPVNEQSKAGVWRRIVEWFRGR